MSGWIDIDEEWDSLINTWAFGPQGHPASMRVSVVLFDERKLQPEIWVFGPTFLHHHTVKLTTIGQLKPLLEYGKRIDERFGTDRLWWRCKRGCVGSFCSHCNKIHEDAKQEVQVWLWDNPPPWENDDLL